MILRSKTKKRLAWLLAGTMVLAVVLAIIVLVRLRQIREQYRSYRETGMAAFKAGDYEAAMTNLGRFVGRNKNDAEALHHLAKARRQVRENNSRHLITAIQFYRRLLELRPDDNTARQELVELFSEVGYYSEALDAAKRLLEKEPDNLVALRAQSRGLLLLRRFDEALPVVERAIKLAPLDLELRVITHELYEQLKRDAELIPQSLALLTAYPEDPRAELVLGMACLANENIPEESQKKLKDLLAARYPGAKLSPPLKAETIGVFFIRQAAQRSAPDATFTRLIVSQLDRLGLPLESLAVLERAATAGSDNFDLHRLLLFRLFEASRYSDIDHRLSRGITRDLEKDAGILALHAISLAQLGRSAEVAPIADRLATLKDDRIAQAWHVVVSQLFLAQQPDMLKVAQSIRDALESTKTSNPYLRSFLGDALAALGERDLAIEAFKQAYAARPTWPQPLVRLSQLLLEAGQSTDAIAAAQAAARLMPTSVNVANWVIVWAGTVQRADLHEQTDLVRLLAEVQRMIPGEPRILSLHILALAQSGKRDVAQKLMREALESKAISEPLLTYLAAVSREAELGLEELCYAKAEELFGGLNPDLALARALDLAQSGKPADGRKLLDDAYRKRATVPTTQNTADQDIAWRLTVARYLDAVQDSEAAAAWIALGDDPSLKANLAVQRAALAAPSVQTNRAFLARTIDRIRALTGDQSIGWRVARARLLLRDHPSDADLNEASKLLEEIIAASEQLEPRLLLAAVHERRGNITGAIEQLAAALKIKPESASIKLELARLHQSQSNFQRAREQLDQIRPEQLDSAQRHQFAALLIQQGDVARAAAAVEGDRTPTTRPSDRLLLAELYRRRNEAEKAERIYEELLKEPSPTVITAAANFYASTGRKSEAEKILQGLRAFELEPGLWELAWGDYWAAYGTPDQAIQQYSASLKLSPSRTNVWRTLIALYARVGRINEALAACDEARKVLPHDPDLDRLAANADVIRALAPVAVFHQLIAAAVQPLSGDIACEALKVAAEATQAKLPPAVMVTKLRPIADRAPGLIPLQLILIEYCLASGQIESATAIAQRTLIAAPASIEVAQTAARVFVVARDWTPALAAADRWRELTLHQPVAADVFIAQIHLRRGDVAAARKQIASHLGTARAKPEEYLPVLVTQAQVLMAENELDKAASLIWPHVAQSAEWRRAWLELALSISSKPAAAAAWLDRLSTVVPGDAANERMALAQAWQELAIKSGDVQAFAKAEALLTPLAATTDKPALVFFTLGLLHESQGNLEKAEKAYRRALELQPGFPEAQNNLAMIILNRGMDPAQAVTLATHAVQTNPRVAAFHDTLAQAKARAKDYAGAIESMRQAIALESMDPKWRLGLIEIYEQANRIQEAKQALADLHATLGNASRMPSNLQARLEKIRTRLNGRSTTSSSHN